MQQFQALRSLRQQNLPVSAAGEQEELPQLQLASPSAIPAENDAAGMHLDMASLDMLLFPQLGAEAASRGHGQQESGLFRQGQVHQHLGFLQQGQNLQPSSEGPQGQVPYGPGVSPQARMHQPSGFPQYSQSPYGPGRSIQASTLHGITTDVQQQMRHAPGDPQLNQLQQSLELRESSDAHRLHQMRSFGDAETRPLSPRQMHRFGR